MARYLYIYVFFYFHQRPFGKLILAKMNKKQLKHLYIASFVLSLMLSACSPTKNIQDDLHKKLVGEWRNVYVKIKINNPEAGKSVIMEADSTNWEEKLDIKPIRTFFKEDGTYYSEFRDIKDSITGSPSGLWSLKGDTISMTQNKQGGTVTKMRLRIAKDKATFSGMIDFQGDGKADDEYFGIQRRFSH